MFYSFLKIFCIIQLYPFHTYRIDLKKTKSKFQKNKLCTQAISLLSTSKVPGYKRRELTSFALSNRGVARIMSENDTAALSDFYEAVQISKNELVNHNLSRAKQNLAL